MRSKGATAREEVHQPGKAGVISMHQPHPGSELKSYQVREVLLLLKGEGYL